MKSPGIKRTAPPRQYVFPSRWSEKIIETIFRKIIKKGAFTLKFQNTDIVIGKEKPTCAIFPPTIFRFFRMLLAPDYRLPAYYARGYWDCSDGDLYKFLDLITSQKLSSLHVWFNLHDKNPVRDRITYRIFPMKVKENIAIHYNTSPLFMKLVLGQTLEYTCAFFEKDNEGIASAQNRKIDKVIERLSIQHDHQVLDLGCGWGQIAETVSRLTGAHVTGINITPNQIHYASQNKSDRTDFINVDYEEYSNSEAYDRIYSIGMLEHIGLGKLDRYFAKIAELLRPDGIALVHCIVRTRKGSTNSWIDREVFPGAYIPQLSEVINAIDLSTLCIENIFCHAPSNYYRTLQAWENNFRQNYDELFEVIRTNTGDQDAETIMRIWEFYFSGSQLAFNNHIGHCYNVQILLKPRKSGWQLHRQ